MAAGISSGRFNLPSDPPGYPQFQSLRDRRTYITEGLKARFEKWVVTTAQEHLERVEGLRPPAPRGPKPRSGKGRFGFGFGVSAGGERRRSSRNARCGRRAIAGDDDDEEFAENGECEEEEYDHEGELDGAEEEEQRHQEAEEGLTEREERYQNRMHDICHENYNQMHITFVGDFCPKMKFHFEPNDGDLIISHFAGRPLGLPNSVGYIASYRSNSCEFRNHDLLLRLGNFEKLPNNMRDISSQAYMPFGPIELFTYRQDKDTFVEFPWIFLGRQAPLARGYIPPDSSPGLGKSLLVGSLLDQNQAGQLTPRRGDVIIKGQVWDRHFDHPHNFWRSMVKWYRDRPNFAWAHGDMLIRRFQDNCYHCDKKTCQDKYGWVELYQRDGYASKWVFWGRSRVFLGSPWPNRTNFSPQYTCDDGKHSDDEEG